MDEVKVTIRYDPDALMVNAPFGAHPQASVEEWVRRAKDVLTKDGYDVTFEEKSPIKGGFSFEITEMSPLSDYALDEVAEELYNVTDGYWHKYLAEGQALFF